MAVVAQEILSTLEQWFPPALAESWDNVGLLLGDRSIHVSRIMTVLTLTPETAAEAIERRADLILTHHPIWFRPIQRLTADGPGGFVYRLARAGILVYSPHTAFDGALDGINAQIAARLGLCEIAPLRAADDSTIGEFGAGRWGKLPQSVGLSDLAARVAMALTSRPIGFVGSVDRACRSVAIGCGAGFEFAADALRLGCDVLITGEARFHQCLEARAEGLGLILAGHYATERFALETLAHRLAQHWPGLEIWCSQQESDPVTWVD